MAPKPKILVITGATASGKSAFIYRNLGRYPLTIINADSRQIYQGITIASAAPGADELALLPHALFNFLPPGEAFSAGAFMRAARLEIDKALQAGRIPLVCGGTYFYLNALFYGLLPAIPISNEIREAVEAMPAAQAFAELKALDAAAADANHPHNVVRVKRALMLCKAHGGAINGLSKTGGIIDDFNIRMLIFDMDRTLLRQRIAERVTAMFAAGLVGEIQKLLAAFKAERDITTWRQVPALTGIGVREFLEMFERTARLPAELSAEELQTVQRDIAQNTIHLVKRQQTWYKNAEPKPGDTKTVDPSYENERIAALVNEFLGGIV